MGSLLTLRALHSLHFIESFPGLRSGALLVGSGFLGKYPQTSESRQGTGRPPPLILSVSGSSGTVQSARWAVWDSTDCPFQVPAHPHPRAPHGDRVQDGTVGAGKAEPAAFEGQRCPPLPATPPQLCPEGPHNNAKFKSMVTGKRIWEQSGAP